jgi:small conductance mechanosensitive channel
MIDFSLNSEDAGGMVKSLLEKEAGFDRWSLYLQDLLGKATDFGLRIIACILIYWIGRKIIRYIERLLNKIFIAKSVEPSLASFLKSMINILLMVVLIAAIIDRLGINTTSFVAILASCGIAIGMALSGNLQNFAGGVIILLFKPFRIGDFIQAQGQEGTVKEITIFDTEITTPDNRSVFIPNGGLSSNVIVNYNNEKTRRIDLVVGVDYGTDYDFAKSVVLSIIADDKRILKNPEPLVALKTLNSSSVDLLLRVWVKRTDYWDVNFSLNEQIYKVFSQKGIGIPFPQMTVHLPNFSRG